MKKDLSIKEKISYKLVSFMISKGGIVVRKIAAYVVGGLTAASIIPAVDAPSLEAGLVSGGMSVVAIAYAWFESWVNKQRNKRFEDAMTEAVKTDPNRPDRIGHEKIEDFTKRTGIPVRRATLN